jgi:hypothetical protein
LLGQELLFVSAFRLYVEERLEVISLHCVLRFLAYHPREVPPTARTIRLDETGVKLQPRRAVPALWRLSFKRIMDATRYAHA